MSDSTEPNSTGLATVPSEWNMLTSRIIEAAMDVHTILGPGLLEGVYEDALCYEFVERGIGFQQQLRFPIMYKNRVLREQRCDLLVEQLVVVVELKSTNGIEEKFLSTMLGYMRGLDAPLGLLLNFHNSHLRDGIHRRVNSRSSKFHTPSISVRSQDIAFPSSSQRTSA